MIDHRKIAVRLFFPVSAHPFIDGCQVIQHAVVCFPFELFQHLMETVGSDPHSRKRVFGNLLRQDIVAKNLLQPYDQTSTVGPSR